MPGLREDLEAAWADVEARPEGQEGVVPQQVDTSIVDTDPYADKPADKPARERAEDGKFAPKTAAVIEEPKLDAEGKPAPKVPTPAPLPGQTKAPVSWKPEVREKWESTDPIVRNEIVRREREIDEALRTTAEARQFHQAVVQITQPYEHIFRSQNVNTITAIDNAMRSMAMLYTAPPAQKADLVAQMIQHFGVDLQTLDRHLSARIQGNPVAPQVAPQQQFEQVLEQRLRPMNEFLSGIQQQQMQAVKSEADAFFQDPANEYAWDVKDDMADLMEIAAKRGQTLSLQDAYKRATLAHPTISALVQRSAQSQGAAQLTAAARRAKEAAASIPGTGAPSRGEENESDGSLRGDLMASVRQLSRPVR